jgi:hypothetical protein
MVGGATTRPKSSGGVSIPNRNRERGLASGPRARPRMEPLGAGTLYRATVLHSEEKACREHAAMGFEEGWGKALDQLVEHMKRTG